MALPNNQNAPSIDRYAVAWDATLEIRAGIVWLVQSRCLRVDGVIRLDGAIKFMGSK